MSRDAFEVRWNPIAGDRRKQRFEPRGDGRWDMIEYRSNGYRWLFVGEQIVADVGRVSDAEIVDGSDQEVMTDGGQ